METLCASSESSPSSLCCLPPTTAIQKLFPLHILELPLFIVLSSLKRIEVHQEASHHSVDVLIWSEVDVMLLEAFVWRLTMSDNMPLFWPSVHLFSSSFIFFPNVWNIDFLFVTSETQLGQLGHIPPPKHQRNTSTLGRLEAAISTVGGSSCSNWQLASHWVTQSHWSQHVSTTLSTISSSRSSHFNM